MTTTLIIPGLHSSGPTHWQTWIETRVTGSVRVTQNDWSLPSLPDWASRVRREIVRASGPVTIVAHSFGALAAAQAAADHSNRVSGALLVAPADPQIFGVGEVLPQMRLDFPAIVVASTNDPWMPFDVAEIWAERWGAELISLGRAGHINSETGFGPWPLAVELLQQLRHAARSRAELDRVATLTRSANASLPVRRRAAFPRFAKMGGNRDLLQAASLLRAAGWSVREPVGCSLGAR